MMFGLDSIVVLYNNAVNCISQILSTQYTVTVFVRIFEAQDFTIEVNV